MFIAVTRIRMPKQAADHAAEGFKRAAPDLKRFDGFLGFELWRNEDTLEAVSRWESREAMEEYTNSDAFRAHHGGSSNAQSQGSAEVIYYEGETVV